MSLISSPHSAGYLRQKIILLRRGTKEGQNQILFMRELSRRLNPIDKDKMNRLKTLKYMYMLWKNKENLEEEKKEKLEEILKAHPYLGIAYEMNEEIKLN
jgi:transposase